MTAKYIFFALIEEKPKTKVYEVRTRIDHSVLGLVKWFPRWRQYAFFPKLNTIYSEGCLKEVADEISHLMLERMLSKT